MIILPTKNYYIYGRIKQVVRHFIYGIEKGCSFFIQYYGIRRTDKLYASLVDKNWRGLTKNQHREIDVFWSKYANIRHCSHAFYFQKTGIFCKEYVPDGLWRYVIDPYFNNWDIAKHIDNKCYYHRMFLLKWGGGNYA